MNIKVFMFFGLGILFAYIEESKGQNSMICFKNAVHTSLFKVRKIQRTYHDRHRLSFIFVTVIGNFGIETLDYFIFLVKKKDWAYFKSLVVLFIYLFLRHN